MTRIHTQYVARVTHTVTCMDDFSFFLSNWMTHGRKTDVFRFLYSLQSTMWLFDDVFSGLCVAVLLTALLLLLRLVSVMPWRRWKGDGSGGSFAAKGRGCGGTASTLVVMGSGGHTTEMLGLIKVLPKAMLVCAPL